MVGIDDAFFCFCFLVVASVCLCDLLVKASGIGRLGNFSGE